MRQESVLELGFFTNPLIFTGLGLELLLQLFIVYHPWGNRLFSTAPLPVSVWLMLPPFAFLLFLAEEVRKKFVRDRA